MSLWRMGIGGPTPMIFDQTQVWIKCMWECWEHDISIISTSSKAWWPFTRSKSISGGCRKEMVTAPTKGMSAKRGRRWTLRLDEVRERLRIEAEAGGTYEGRESRAHSICSSLKFKIFKKLKYLWKNFGGWLKYWQNFYCEISQGLILKSINMYLFTNMFLCSLGK